MKKNNGSGGNGHDALLNYFDSLRSDFDDGVRRARAYYAVEGIHDLRVATKKLRAFFRLVAALQPEFDPRSVARPLKPLYGIAGQLRDIDIQQEIVLDGLNRFQISEFANELKQMEFALRPALLSSAKELKASVLSEAGRAIGRTLKPLSTDQVTERLDLRMHAMIAQVSRFLSLRTPSVLELHDVRKSAKAAKYTLDVWQLIHSPSRRATQTSALLKEVYTHLGTWHDLRVTQDAISTFLRRETPRNLFDQSAYSAFLTQIGTRENSHLKAYRASAGKLGAALADWNMEQAGSTGASTRRQAGPARTNRSKR